MFLNLTQCKVLRILLEMQGHVFGGHNNWCLLTGLQRCQTSYSTQNLRNIKDISLPKVTSYSVINTKVESI